MDPGDFAGRMANILDGHHIGTTENIGQADQRKMLQALGHALAKRNAPGTMRITDRCKIFTDNLQGLGP